MSKSSRTIPAASVAEFFIDKANKEGKIITNKKIQKLVYYAQAWSLVLRKEKLFNEKIEAWVHGPAIKTLYDRYKTFGYSPIRKDADKSLLAGISSEQKKLLEEVWKVYGKYDSYYLETLTHSESPWQDARAGLESSTNSNAEITTSSMEDFYSSKLEEKKK